MSEEGDDSNNLIPGDIENMVNVRDVNLEIIDFHYTHTYNNTHTTTNYNAMQLSQCYIVDSTFSNPQYLYQNVLQKLTNHPDTDASVITIINVRNIDITAILYYAMCLNDRRHNFEMSEKTTYNLNTLRIENTVENENNNDIMFKSKLNDTLILIFKLKTSNGFHLSILKLHGLLSLTNKCLQAISESDCLKRLANEISLENLNVTSYMWIYNLINLIKCSLSSLNISNSFFRFNSLNLQDIEIPVIPNIEQSMLKILIENRKKQTNNTQVSKIPPVPIVNLRMYDNKYLGKGSITIFELMFSFINFKNLMHLNIASTRTNANNSINDKIIQLIFDNTTNLITFDCSNCTLLSDKSLETIGTSVAYRNNNQHSGFLKLVMNGCTQLTFEGIKLFANESLRLMTIKQISSLHTLDFKNCLPTNLLKTPIDCVETKPLNNLRDVNDNFALYHIIVHLKIQRTKLVKGQKFKFEFENDE